MTRLYIIFTLILSFLSVNLSAGYKKITMDNNKSNYDLLYKIGADLELVRKNNSVLSAVVSDNEYSLINDMGIKHNIEINDLEAYYANRYKDDLNSLEFKKANQTLSFDFKLGSMGGMLTVSETKIFFDDLIKKYPSLLKSKIIGYSYEKRPIYAYFLGVDSNTAQVLLTSVHHAREGAGLMEVCYFVKHILSKYDATDDEAKYLLQNRYIVLVPIVNPDGYEYNRMKNSAGGGLWRKNRKPFGDNYGVDLNRNYGPQEFWDLFNGSGATDVTTEVYKGEAPFSEPETQSIRDLCLNSNFKTALNFHAYSNLLLYPYSAWQIDCPDSNLFRGIGFYSYKRNHYNFGLDSSLLGYSCPGNSNDWMYVQVGKKTKIIAATPELGSDDDNFWPKASRIIAICQEALPITYSYVWAAGLNLAPLQAMVTYNYSFKPTLKFEIRNVGVESSPKTNFVQIESLNPKVTFANKTYLVGSLSPGESDTAMFIPTVSADFYNGTFVKFVISVNVSGVIKKDTFEIKLYTPFVETIFSGNEIEKWSANMGWSLSKDFDGKPVFSDSPDGLYYNSVDNYLEYKNNIDLAGFNKAEITYLSKWEIEPDYDFGLVEVLNNGIWTSIKSEYTRKASGKKDTPQSGTNQGLDGNMPWYVYQTVSLDDYIGKTIKFRFRILSDGSGSRKGWDIKEVILKKYGQSLDVMPGDISNSFNIYPNPVKRGSAELKFDLPLPVGEYANVRIYNTLGDIILENQVNDNKIELSGKILAPGIYTIELISGKNVYRNKFVVTE